MKKILMISCLLAGTICFAQTGNTGIGTPTPYASTQLDIANSIKGILIPKMSVT